MARGALVIENFTTSGQSNFTGTGPLHIKLKEALGTERTDYIDCTTSTLAGTVTTPIPDIYAKLTGWTMTGCTPRGFGGTAPTQVLNLSSVPPVEAVSTTKVRVKQPTNSPIRLKVEYFRNGTLCTETVELGTSEYNYSSGTSTNQLTGSVPGFFSPELFDPAECLNGGTATFEATYSFPDPQFEVADRNYQAPTLSGVSASSSTKTNSRLTGGIDPHGLPTKYFFEYGLNSGYGSKAPASEGLINSSLNTAQGVATTITGLQEETTYHFRLVASNAKGTSSSSDKTFTTPVWTTVASPNPAGAGDSRLESVDCGPSSTSMCMAVGKTASSQSGPSSVLAELWNGSSWALSSPVVPAGATESRLEAVTCLTTTSCKAAGSYSTSIGTYSLIEVWNGASWSIQPSSAADVPGASSTVLTGLSCPSGTNVCTAVGYAITGGARTATAARWDGTNWSRQTVPLTPGASATELSSVECRATTFCMAVGRSTNVAENGDTFDHPLSAVWEGSSWALKTVPETPYRWDDLADLSCTGTPVICTAVGDGSYPQLSTLVVRWNGTAWTMQDSGEWYSYLYGVSCSNANSEPCVNVGVRGGLGVSGSFAMRWDGSTWSPEETANPVGPTGHSLVSVLSDVSCRGETCIATGYSADTSSGTTTTLVESSTVAEADEFQFPWEVLSTPIPPGANTSELRDVSCEPSPNFCTSVGKSTASGIDNPVVQRWNGTTWSEQTAAKKSGSTHNRLFGVDCPSEIRCLAVGNYQKSEGGPATLAEIWNENKWAAQTTPVPAGATSSELAGIGCNNTAECKAVGSAITSGVKAAIAEKWNSPTWTLQTVSLPAGATSSQLDGVDCLWSNFCVAVGRYTTSGGAVKSLATFWNGTEWKLQSLSDPEGAVQTTLLDVSCTPSPNRCMVVGDWKNGKNEQLTLAYRFNGTSTWTLQSTPNASESTEDVLQDVSCASELSCTATGSAVSGGLTKPLVVSWNGADWSKQSAPGPSGSVFSSLFGVSCRSISCMGVGLSTNSSGVSVPLAERRE
jgi:hypothetical protein